MRGYRARRKAEGSLFDAEALAGYPDDPAGAIAAWSAERLVVPPGHPHEGRPMELPEYGVAFLRDVFRPGIREGSYACARKNAKIGDRGGLAPGSPGRSPSAVWLAGWRVFNLKAESCRAQSAMRANRYSVEPSRAQVSSVSRSRSH